VYAQGDPGNGIGGYDLKSGADRAYAFDYDHSGKMDYICLYRPATGTFWIQKNNGGTFNPVYAQGDPGAGIGGYDLRSGADRSFAFDYEHSGKRDYVVLYRPGRGAIFIIKNNGGIFSPVYAQGDEGLGIALYNLMSGADRLFAFDYEHSGKMDYIVSYRPGTGTLWILKNTGGIFNAVYAQGDPGQGCGGFDLKNPADRAFPYDFDSNGKMDYICIYRPGAGQFWVLRNCGGGFWPVYAEGGLGGTANGIAGYDLKSGSDHALPFDYDSSGKNDHIFLYRKGAQVNFIVKKVAGVAFESD